MSKYAAWIDGLLEEGVYFSQFKKMVKEQFPGVSISLGAHVRYRRSQGWKIDERREGDDVFYKVVEKPEKKKEKREVKKVEKEEREQESVVKEEEIVSRRVLYGAGVYMLQEVGDKFKLFVKVGTETKTVEFEQGLMEDIIGGLFGAEVEIKKVEKESGVERGIFVLYKIV
jgi:hypothetical protein